MISGLNLMVSFSFLVSLLLLFSSHHNCFRSHASLSRGLKIRLCNILIIALNGDL